MNKPNIIFADVPTSFMYAKQSDFVMRILMDYVKNNNKTLVLTDCRLEDNLSADLMIKLNHGKIVEYNDRNSFTVI